MKTKIVLFLVGILLPVLAYAQVSNPLRAFPPGTAALPGLWVVGDRDTGIYSAGADTLNIALGGVLRVTAGSSTFTHQRDFNGLSQILSYNTNAAGTGAFAVLTALTDGTQSRIGANSSGYTSSGGYKQDGGFIDVAGTASGGLSIINQNTASPIRFYTGGFADANERAQFEADGDFWVDTDTLFVDATNNRVGVGIAPIARFHIEESLDNAVSSILQNPNAGTSAYTQFLISEATGTGKQGGLFYTNTNTTFESGSGILAPANALGIASGGGASGGIYLRTDHASGPIRFGTGGSAAANERARITAAGNFLFGTATDPLPTVQKFVVSGGNIVHSGASPQYIFNETDQAVDEKNWNIIGSNKNYRIASLDDAITTNRNHLSIVRGTGLAAASIEIGNTTDKAPVTARGTWTFDSGAGTDAVFSESGIDRNSGSAETFNIQNSGAGAMTLQVDGVSMRPIVTATATYDPASLAAGSSRCDDVTVTGMTTAGGAVSANIGAVDPANGCVVATVRVSAADTVRICWRNAVDAVTACDTASSTWVFSQPQ